MLAGLREEAESSLKPLETSKGIIGDPKDGRLREREGGEGKEGRLFLAQADIGCLGQLRSLSRVCVCVDCGE